jgi:hypothetical protein
MSSGSCVKAARIRRLNDELRCKATGGRIVTTKGLQALGTGGITEVLTAVSRFDDFTDDNDPWGEHDCATLTVSGRKVLFKIDYYDLSLTWHSPDASDPAVTQRVLTVMLAEEY